MFGRKRTLKPKATGTPLPPVVERLSAEVIAHFSEPVRGVNIETALVATAATAGTLLLRQHAGSALEGMTPGSAVFGDGVNDDGPRALGRVAALARSVGIDWDDSGDPLPHMEEVRQSEVELVRAVEPVVSGILRDSRTDRSEWADVTLFAALDLLVQAQSVLDPRLGTRILSWSFVVGSKTVPYPVN